MIYMYLLYSLHSYVGLKINATINYDNVINKYNVVKELVVELILKGLRCMVSCRLQVVSYVWIVCAKLHMLQSSQL